MYVDGKLSSLESKGWDKQFILIKPQAGPHAEMHLLKSFDERGREEKREEEELGLELPVIILTEPPAPPPPVPRLYIQEQAQGLRGESRQEPWQRKEN